MTEDQIEKRLVEIAVEHTKLVRDAVCDAPPLGISSALKKVRPRIEALRAERDQLIKLHPMKERWGNL